MTPTADPARIADRVRFLGRTPPFKDLAPDQLHDIAAAVRERAAPAGEAILVEGGPPGEELYVVRLGTLELLHKDAYVAVVTAGEVVGHPTLLTGLAPEFTVRAREDSLLYCLPRDAAVDVLGRPSGIQWMAANSRERLLQAAGTMRAMPDVRTLPVTSVTRSKPLFCDPGTTAQEAAQILIAEKRSAILVRGPGGKGIAGIVTDVDLRNKVVVDGVSRHAPVTEIMSAPVHTIGAEVLAPEASIAMMAAGVNHLPVLDADGEVVGVLSASSLMTLEARSPFALRREIMAARSEEEVVRAGGRHPHAVRRPDDRAHGRTLGDPGAHRPPRHADGPVPRAHHRPARRAAGALRLARLRQRRALGAHAGLRPGQRARLRRHRRPGRGGLLRRARAGPSTPASSAAACPATRTACSRGASSGA